MGEARYRGRLLKSAVDRVERAAVVVAGPSSAPERLEAAIATVREQVNFLEREAERWRSEGEIAETNALSWRARRQIAKVLDRK